MKHEDGGDIFLQDRDGSSSWRRVVVVTFAATAIALVAAALVALALAVSLAGDVALAFSTLGLELGGQFLLLGEIVAKILSSTLSVEKTRPESSYLAFQALGMQA